MRIPSDAQARCLEAIEQHIARGDRVRLEASGAVGVWYPGCGWGGHYYHGIRPATARVVWERGWVEGYAVDEAVTATTLTEDGTIALGLWRSRKLRSPPPKLPELSAREREIAELALRALELGYALCAREPARGEARRMRRAGWITDCWVANAARGMVPTPLALVEIRPDEADRPVELPS